MTDNICTSYGQETDQFKAYRILAGECERSIEEACKAKYSKPEDVTKCIANPDQYLPENKTPSFFKVLGRIFGYSNLNTCRQGACTYVREIGYANILTQPASRREAPPATVTETRQVADPKPADAFEVLVDASRTNLELFVGKPNYRQKLEIEVMCNGVSKRVSPKPIITYTITKESDSTYKMIYSIEIAGRSFAKDEAIIFHKNPKLAFRIRLWKECDFDSINQLKLIVK